MDKLQQLFTELENKIPKAEAINTAVSASPVGWHIEHTLMVTNTIIGAIKTSDPNRFRWKFNLMRSLILTMGKIPRGKVKAPSSVQIADGFNTDRIATGFLKVKHNFDVLQNLPRNHYFTHPFFGDLNIAPAKTFLRIHTKHHLKIIEDILKAR